MSRFKAPDVMRNENIGFRQHRTKLNVSSPRDEIVAFAVEMERIMQEHDAVKGDTWKTCGLGFLDGKLQEEISEYVDSPCRSSKCDELVDIANICMMLHYRRMK